MQQKRVILSLISLLVLMIGCTSTKQPAAFRQLKKEADTLIVISPYLEIVAFDYRNKVRDNELEESNKEIIQKVTNKLLSSKYVVKNIETPAFDSEKLYALVDEMDNLPKESTAGRPQTLFPPFNETDNKQLAIFLVFYGEYNSVNSAVGMNTMSSSWSFSPSARPHSDFRLLVLNMQTNEIVFYNKYSTRSYGANSAADMEKMTRGILKEMYYK